MAPQVPLAAKIDGKLIKSNLKGLDKGLKCLWILLATNSVIQN
jgi:hypothetical protein